MKGKIVAIVLLALAMILGNAATSSAQRGRWDRDNDRGYRDDRGDRGRSQYDRGPMNWRDRRSYGHRHRDYYYDDRPRYYSRGPRYGRSYYHPRYRREWRPGSWYYGPRHRRMWRPGYYINIQIR